MIRVARPLNRFFPPLLLHPHWVKGRKHHEALWIWAGYRLQMKHASILDGVAAVRQGPWELAWQHREGAHLCSPCRWSQVTVEEVMTTTAYLDLFLRSISEPALLEIFLRFILLHQHETVHILDTLTSRINTPFRVRRAPEEGRLQPRFQESLLGNGKMQILFSFSSCSCYCLSIWMQIHYITFYSIKNPLTGRWYYL